MTSISARFFIQSLFCLGSNLLCASPDFWDEIPLSPSTMMPVKVQDDYWNGEFQRVNREVVAAQNARLVFFGDSITWSWSLGPATGREIWENQFKDHHPINMGNSGDITPVMLCRVTHGNLDFPEGKQPKVAVLLCGINNFGVTQSDGGKEKWDLGINCPPVDIANGQRALAQVFRRRMPQTRLILMAILPVADKVKWAKCQQVNATNAAMEYNGNEVAYVNLQDKFLLPDGMINRSLFTDGIHLTAEGYRVWAKGIEPLVQQFMDAPPLRPEKIMLIGDSITEGLDSNTSYRSYLDGMLRRSGRQIDLIGSRKKHNDDRTEPDSYQYDVDHEGHWGKDSAWMAENMPRLLTGKVPDVAVIHLGTEDVISSKADAEPLTDQIVRNINRVAEVLRSKNANVKIVLSKAIPMKGRGEVMDLLNVKISQYAQSHSTPRQPVVLADPNVGFDYSLDLTDAGTLPNASGAKKMAEAFAEAIQRLPGGEEPK
jgi:lysophospholipase L1-like esterase